VAASVRAVAPTISVGLLTADLMALGAAIRTLEQSAVRLLHFDVMDGCFTPMMTFGPPLIKAARTSLLKDVHLMIEDPLDKAADYVAAGADIVTIHVESAPRHVHRVLQHLGTMANANDAERGVMRGIALNPGTPLETVEPLIGEVELILLLAINPGWGGQKLLPAALDRVRVLKDMVAGRGVLVGLDGGVTRGNIEVVAAAGADLIVTGSAVFDGKDVLANAAAMLAAVNGVGGSSMPAGQDSTIS
jgi:ribulose-phosphate 3-epimerase